MISTVYAVIPSNFMSGVAVRHNFITRLAPSTKGSLSMLGLNLDHNVCPLCCHPLAPLNYPESSSLATANEDLILSKFVVFCH